ncbi:MAG: hypothetical protein K8I30_06240, partial [Anaerolineae bacterium]|nr:hypothetical protein [Anaerolineae bacterium]
MPQKRFLVFLVLILIAAACQIVPGTGDQATDAAAAQNFVPASIAGYNATEATSITDALTKTGIGASVLTGNLALAGAIAKLDGMIQCYQGVGAVSAKVYTEQNMPTTGIPKIGALAVINTTRLGRNFLQCAVNLGGASAQAANEIQPCGGSGSFKVNNEDLEYMYAATAPELCTT